MSNILGKLKTEVFNFIYPQKGFNSNHPFKHYNSILENQSFSIFAPKDEKIVAAHENVICTQKKDDCNILYLYSDISRTGMRSRIILNEKTFPGLIEGSKIQLVLLLPFIYKDIARGNCPCRWRLVVITDKCQVYYNQPDELLGKKSAETTFYESLIWDLPGNRYPSLNVECEEYEYYNPFLPDSVYTYHPAGNSSKCIEAEGKNGTKVKLSRFYFPNRTANANSFSYMGGYEPDYVINLVGTYLGNSSKETAGRIVVFATTDGGKNWYAKYEFNDSGTSLNYGNLIHCKEIEAGKSAFPTDIELIKRELLPSETEGMVLKSGQRHKVRSIIWGDTVELIFDEEHGLTSGEIVALQGSGKEQYERALLNNEFTDGTYGNGIFYKVKAVDDYRIQLFELVSKSRTNLPARHIHSINRVKDGFLVATGETYPNGWLLMINLRSADSYGDVSAKETFDSTDITNTGTFSVVRLNTAKNSIQRIVGATMIPSREPEIVYASDCSSRISQRYELKNGGVIISNSIGIFKGKLRDADDATKFSLLEEVREPSFFFKVLDNCYIFSGQRGELAIGTKCGTEWVHGRLNGPLVHYMGRTLNYFVIDGMILLIK